MRSFLAQFSLFIATLMIGLVIGNQSEEWLDFLEPSAQNAKKALDKSDSKINEKKTIKSVFHDHIEKDLNRQLAESAEKSPWLNVAQIKLDDHSTLGKSLISSLNLGAITEKAPHHIEVVILDVLDSQRSGIAIQLKLIDTAKNNRIEEVSRTYFFDEVPVTF